VQVPLIVAGVGLALLMAAGMDDERGGVMAAAAFALYGSLFVWYVLDGDGMRAFSRAHPVADRMLLAPLVFFALAMLTNLPLLACGAIAVACAAAFVLLRRPPRTIEPF
jgi:hypothetical protein